MKKKIQLCFLTFIFIFSLIGCWDKVELNERAYVSAIGVDKFDHEKIVEESKKKKEEEEQQKQGGQETPGKEGEEDSKESNKMKKPSEEEPKKREEEKELEEENIVGVDRPKDIKRNRYILSYTIPNLGKMKEGLDISGEDVKFSRSIVAPSLSEGSNAMGGRFPRKVYYGHAKAVVIGKELAEDKDLMKDLIEGLERDHEIDRRMYVVVADGTAKDVIQNLTTIEPYTGTYIRDIFENKDFVSRFVYTDLDRLAQSFRNEGDVLLPKIIIGKEEYKIGGAAVLRQHQFVGWLNEEECQAILWITDKIKGGTVSTEDKDIFIPYEVTSANVTKEVYKKEDGKIILQLNIRAEGNLNTYAYDKEELMSNTQIMKLEKKIEGEIKRNIEDTMKKIQKEFKADVVSLGDFIEKNNQDIWKEVKDNWREQYETIEIQINPKVYIRRIGVIQ